MKVLHIVKTDAGAMWVYHQVRVLRSLGIEIVVALPSARCARAADYRRIGAAVIEADLELSPSKIWNWPAKLAACRRLVDEIQPDVVHSHHVGTTLVLRHALGKSSTIPRIFQVAGPLHLEHRFFAKLDINSAGPQDHWIATCEWTRKKYGELGINPDHIFLSYAGTDLSLFGEARGGQLRRELGIDSQAKLVGMVAYMYPPRWFLRQTTGLKGHEDFIAALGMVQKEKLTVRGVIIGGPWGEAGWYERRLREMGRNLCGGNLVFLGTRTDVPEIYPDLDLAVVPSHSENVGGAVEPLLSRVPVVATNVGGLPDLVREYETGWQVPPHNPAALKEAISAALRDPKDAIQRAERGRELARSLFNVERTAREVASIYEQVLAFSSAGATSV